MKKRSFDHRVEHATIAGSDKVARPRILALTSGYRSVRICALGTDPPGKTSGYWESRYALTSTPGGDARALRAGRLPLRGCNLQG